MPKKLKKKDPLAGKIFECIILVALFILFVLPFYYMIISSFKTTIEAAANPPVWWPAQFLWSNFADAWEQANFAKYGMNSLIISAAVVVTCLTCSVPCAFAFGRMEFKFKKPLFAIILSDMMVPVQCIFLPLFIQFTDWGIMNKYSSYFLYYLYSGSTIFFFRNAFKQVPNDMLEAARLDGASELRICFQIVMPLCKPVLASIGFLFLVGKWNDWMTSMLYIREPELYSLQYLLQKILQEAQYLQQLADAGMLNSGEVFPTESFRYAMAMVAAGPVLCVFPFFQKYFAKGMTVGSVKG